MLVNPGKVLGSPKYGTSFWSTKKSKRAIPFKSKALYALSAIVVISSRNLSDVGTGKSKTTPEASTNLLL